MPKKLDPELKARAVRLVLEHRAEYPTKTAAVLAVARADRGGQGVAAPLGALKPRSTRGERAGVTSEEHEEIKRLKAENRRLREDVAILKAATSFFAGELDPRNR